MVQFSLHRSVITFPRGLCSTEALLVSQGQASLLPLEWKSLPCVISYPVTAVSTIFKFVAAMILLLALETVSYMTVLFGFMTYFMY
jgi:hypothetical protein